MVADCSNTPAIAFVKQRIIFKQCEYLDDINLPGPESSQPRETHMEVWRLKQLTALRGSKLFSRAGEQGTVEAQAKSLQT